MKLFMTFFNEENELLYILFARETKKNYTVTGLWGRTDDVKIIGNGTLVVWGEALQMKVNICVLQAMMLGIQFPKLTIWRLMVKFVYWETNKM